MAVQFRSGKEVGNNSKKEKKEETDVEQEETRKEEEKSIQNEQPEESSEQRQKERIPAYTLTVPFPQRLQKAKREEQFSKFLDIFKKIEINIPFAD